MAADIGRELRPLRKVDLNHLPTPPTPVDWTHAVVPPDEPEGNGTDEAPAICASLVRFVARRNNPEGVQRRSEIPMKGLGN